MWRKNYTPLRVEFWDFQTGSDLLLVLIISGTAQKYRRNRFRSKSETFIPEVAYWFRVNESEARNMEQNLVLLSNENWDFQTGSVELVIVENGNWQSDSDVLPVSHKSDGKGNLKKKNTCHFRSETDVFKPEVTSNKRKRREEIWKTMTHDFQSKAEIFEPEVTYLVYWVTFKKTFWALERLEQETNNFPK